VQWAPRGNKISYVVRSVRGDFIRIVHIPTGTPLSLDFETAMIQAAAWDSKGEHIAVAYSTPDASDRVEVMQFRGGERRVAIEPRAKLDVAIEPIARGAIAIRPRDVQYGEKLPVVVWIDSEPFAWSDARAELMRNARVACIVIREASDELWRAVNETAWLDRERMFVVECRDGLQPVRARAVQLRAEARSYIVTDPALAANQYRVNGRVVTVAPAVIQSFAARFIADRLERTNPANARRR